MNTAALQPVHECADVSERCWTVEEFYRAIDDGVFPEPKRLELIQGRVIEHMPPSPLHSDTADFLAECLRAALSPRFRVREERPIHLATDSEPIPDVTVVPQGRRYRGRHATPQDVVLVAEVAVSSADDDLGWKALLYAQAGIADYWVVLPEQEEIVVHRTPAPDGYQSVLRLGREDTVSPLAAEDVALSVRDLLGLAGEESGT